MSAPAEELPTLDEPDAPPAPRPRRRIPRAAIAAAAVLAALAAYRYLRPANGTAPAGYVTAAVDRGPIEQTVNATGTVNPVTTVQVGTYVSGPIQAIDVTFNSPVKKDQRVAKIDPAPFAVKVREGEANLLNAKAKVLKDQDDVVIMPFSTAERRVLGTQILGTVDMIFASTATAAAIPEAEQQIRALLHERHRILAGQDDDFTVRDLNEIADASKSASEVMTNLLLSVASVSLLVGGIGIMNIMLVSVTERTREIGVRLAVGARTRHILFQFLVEATALSLVGGAAGVVLGIGATRLIARAVSRGRARRCSRSGPGCRRPIARAGRVFSRPRV